LTNYATRREMHQALSDPSLNILQRTQTVGK